jgi:4-hydroxybenzoate polyprenyltransferase
MSAGAVAVCVDLNGTLTAARTSDEQLLWLAKHEPARLFSMLTGAGAARGSNLDVELLPYRSELLDWLRAQRTAGRSLVLLADGDRRTAERIAAHLQLFDEVVSTQPPAARADIAGIADIAAERKRDALVSRFGERGFDYVTADPADERVWSAARGAVVIGGAALAERVARTTALLQHIVPPQGSSRRWVKAMRLHQWVKNALVFLPALLAHRILSPPVMGGALLAFLAFGMCASSVYLFNDLLDLDADRRHFRKRHRPFAAATLSVRSGLAVGCLLFAASVTIALAVNLAFAGVLAAYFVLTWAYSLRLKRVALLDVMMLAGLYTIRLIAASAASNVILSFWLLAFSVFIFLSLGFVKRYAELEVAVRGEKSVGHGRGYRGEDLPLIMNLGTASGYCAIVVIAVYINSADSLLLYRHHKTLWLICPLLLFWISRVWMLTARGHMHEDPVVFALRDRISLIVVALLGLIVSIAI